MDYEELCDLLGRAIDRLNSARDDLSGMYGENGLADRADSLIDDSKDLIEEAILLIEETPR